MRMSKAQTAPLNGIINTDSLHLHDKNFKHWECQQKLSFWRRNTYPLAYVQCGNTWNLSVKTLILEKNYLPSGISAVYYHMRQLNKSYILIIYSHTLSLIRRTTGICHGVLISHPLCISKITLKILSFLTWSQTQTQPPTPHPKKEKEKKTL